MAKKRANGEGRIRKRKVGRWEGGTQLAMIRRRVRSSTKMYWAELRQRSKGNSKD